MINNILVMLGITSISSFIFYLLGRRGSREQDMEDTTNNRVHINPDGSLEGIFETIEEIEKDNEEFDNKVIKMGEEIEELDAYGLAERINGLFPTTKGLATTEDQSKFDWERASSDDNG